MSWSSDSGGGSWSNIGAFSVGVSSLFAKSSFNFSNESLINFWNVLRIDLNEALSSRLVEGDEAETQGGLIFVSWKIPNDSEDEGTWDMYGLDDWGRAKRDVRLW